jgi:hypothetical protein
MSILTADFILTGLNNKKIIFSRPFLNNDRELMFLHCSEFLQFPKIQFFLNEEKKAIEIRSQGNKSGLILLREMNQGFFEKAMQAKEFILNELRKYTQNLKSGKEKIYIFDSISKESPFYFVSNTLYELGQYSIKFEVGLLYFLNEQGKNNLEFNEMQKNLSSKFAKINKNRYKVQKNEDSYYEMTFGELYQIA